MSKLTGNSLRVQLAVIRNALTDYVLKHNPDLQTLAEKHNVKSNTSRQSIHDNFTALEQYLERNFSAHHSIFKEMVKETISSDDGNQIFNLVLLLRELEIAPEWTLNSNAVRLKNMKQHFLGGHSDEIQAALINSKENAKDPEKWGSEPFFQSMRGYIKEIIAQTRNTTNLNQPLTAAIFAEHERMSAACAIIFDYLHTSKTLGSLNDKVQSHEVCKFIEAFYLQGEYAFGAFPEIEAIKNTYHFAELMQKVCDLPSAYQWETAHGKKNIISIMSEMVFAYDVNKFFPTQREKMPFNLFMVGLWKHKNVMFEQLPLLNDVCRNMSAANAFGEKMAKQYHAIEHINAANEYAENAFEQHSRLHERIGQWLEDGNPLPSYFANLKHYQNFDDFVAFELSGSPFSLSHNGDLGGATSLESALSDFVATLHTPDTVQQFAPAWQNLFWFLGDKRPNLEDNEQIATHYPELITAIAQAIQERAKTNNVRQEQVHEGMETVFKNSEVWYDLLNDELNAVENDDFNTEVHIHERAMLLYAKHHQRNQWQPLIVRGQNMAVVGMDFGKPFLPFNDMLLDLQNIEQSIWAAQQDELAKEQAERIAELSKKVDMLLNPNNSLNDNSMNTEIKESHIMNAHENNQQEFETPPQIPRLSADDFSDEFDAATVFSDDVDKQIADFMTGDIEPITVDESVQPVQPISHQVEPVRPAPSPAVLELLATDVKAMPQVRFIPAQNSLPQVNDDEITTGNLNDLKQRIEKLCLLFAKENSIKNNKISDFKIHTHALKQSAAACDMAGAAIVFWLMDWHLKYCSERAGQDQYPHLHQEEFDTLLQISEAVRAHIVNNPYYPAANHAQMTTPSVWEMPFFEWLNEVKKQYPQVEIRDNKQFIDYTANFPDFYADCVNKESALFLSLPKNEAQTDAPQEQIQAAENSHSAHANTEAEYQQAEKNEQPVAAPVAPVAAGVVAGVSPMATQVQPPVPQQIIVQAAAPALPIEVVENGIKVYGKIIPFDEWFNHMKTIENSVNFLSASIDDLKNAANENTAAHYPNEERAYQNISDSLFAMNLTDLGLIFYDVAVAHNDDTLPMPTKIAIQINETSCAALEMLLEKNYDNLPWHSFEIIKLMTQRARQTSGILLSLMNQNEQQERIAVALSNVAEKVVTALNVLSKNNEADIQALKNGNTEVIKIVSDLNAKQSTNWNADEVMSEIANAMKRTENQKTLEMILDTLLLSTISNKLTLLYSGIAPYETQRQNYVAKHSADNPNIVLHPIGQSVAEFMKDSPEFGKLLVTLMKSALTEHDKETEGGGKSILGGLGLFKK